MVLTQHLNAHNFIQLINLSFNESTFLSFLGGLGTLAL